MNASAPLFEELRINIERLRAMLESLVVRGLRACGPDDLALLKSSAEHLDQTGAGHVAAVLSELQAKIEKDDRSAARCLLKAQTSVRLLERLLTLRVVQGQYELAILKLDNPDATTAKADENDSAEDET